MSGPSGTVTFLFTDVEGSTRLLETAPDAMRVALVRHDEIAQTAIRGHELGRDHRPYPRPPSCPAAPVVARPTRPSPRWAHPARRSRHRRDRRSWRQVACDVVPNGHHRGLQCLPRTYRRRFGLDRLHAYRRSAQPIEGRGLSSRPGRERSAAKALVVELAFSPSTSSYPLNADARPTPSSVRGEKASTSGVIVVRFRLALRPPRSLRSKLQSLRSWWRRSPAPDLVPRPGD